MGEVGIVYKIMPVDVETDLEKVVSDLRSGMPDVARINKVEKKPIAFGLNCLELQLIMDDKQGGGDRVEEFISGVEGVSSLEVLTQTLIS